MKLKLGVTQLIWLHGYLGDLLANPSIDKNVLQHQAVAASIHEKIESLLEPRDE